MGCGGQRAGGSQGQARLGPDPRHQPRQHLGAFISPRPVFLPAEGAGGALPSRLAEGVDGGSVRAGELPCACVQAVLVRQAHRRPGPWSVQSSLCPRRAQPAGPSSRFCPGVENGRCPQRRVSLPSGGGQCVGRGWRASSLRALALALALGLGLGLGGLELPCSAEL